MRRYVTGEVFYTDWIEVGDNQNGLFRALPVDREASSSPIVTIEFATKSHDETGDGTLLQDGGDVVALELTTSDAVGDVVQLLFLSTATANEGLKELLRYKINVTGTGWALVELLPPIFFEKAAP
jgi:hypothetical protein